MPEKIPVPAVVSENTSLGEVAFPATVPEGLVELIQFPEDIFTLAPELGLSEKAVKFLMAILGGKWSITAGVDLQDVAIKTGMQYADMDEIVRDLLDRNYAKLNDRLDLYRLWIILLHVKGVRFVEE